MRKFGALRERMLDMEMTSEDIQRLLLLGSSAVSERLNGKRSWTREEMYQVADMLEVPHEYLSILFPADIHSPKRLPEGLQSVRAVKAMDGPRKRKSA